jgi:hypothetical protein
MSKQPQRVRRNGLAFWYLILAVIRCLSGRRLPGGQGLLRGRAFAPGGGGRPFAAGVPDTGSSGMLAGAGTDAWLKLLPGMPASLA